MLHTARPLPGEVLRVLEVGCGSGAIALSLLHERPETIVTAIDISAEAVALTLKNAARYLTDGQTDRRTTKFDPLIHRQADNNMYRLTSLYSCDYTASFQNREWPICITTLTAFPEQMSSVCTLARLRE